MTTSPRSANFTMLRAISEIAVAIRVWSVAEKPARAAISRPFCRATTTSASRDTGTRTTPSVVCSLAAFEAARPDARARRRSPAGDRWRPAPAGGAGRPLDSASSTGRQRSVGGSMPFGGEQVLDAEAGPGAAQPRRDGAGRGALTRRPA